MQTDLHLQLLSLLSFFFESCNNLGWKKPPEVIYSNLLLKEGLILKLDLHYIPPLLSLLFSFPISAIHLKIFIIFFLLLAYTAIIIEQKFRNIKQICGSTFCASALLFQSHCCSLLPIPASRFPLTFQALSPQALPSLFSPSFSLSCSHS